LARIVAQLRAASAIRAAQPRRHGYNRWLAMMKRGAMPTHSENLADLTRPAARKPAWPGLLLLALAPLWLLGMFDRGLWTPDEPREADISWRMSLQSDRSIPHLAELPFLEKPPLTYWLAATSIAAFGDSAALERLPNLLYALIVATAIGTLAARMAGRDAALVAGLMAGSALISYRVAVWLATDAALLAGCAVALLGAYSGYTSSAGSRKFWGYTLMHAGAAFGFMAKSAPGWLVPALALGTLIMWEKRWSELRRWELYAGAALEALMIGPWILDVAGSPGGAESLRVLFWDNLAGRFTTLAASSAHDYAQGHVNWWAKYLVELPVYLLPWTLLAAAALARARDEVRVQATALHPVTTGTSWRFAVCAFLPFLIVLSLAATARDVYAAPAMLGFALLVSLWVSALRRKATRFDVACLALTRYLIVAIACVLAVLLGLFAAAERDLSIVIADLVVAVAVVPLTLIALRFAATLQRSKEFAASIAASYAAYALALTLAGLLVFPVIDRWQDLGALARRIQRDCVGCELAVLDADETTIAMLDHRLRTTFTTLSAGPVEAPGVVAAWLGSHGALAHVLVLLPGHAPGDVSRLMGRWYPLGPSDDGLAGALAASGSARISMRYELPQGRRYALLSAAAR
jgi:4-amino-4-deoxy-L-arabinose transferase-like glycosyltransferase